MRQTPLRRDALVLGSYLILLFGTTSFMPRLWNGVAGWLGIWHQFLPEGVGALLVLLALGVLVKRGSGRFLLQGLLFLCLSVLFFVSMGQLHRPIEKIHFSEYGFLSFLVFRLFRHWDTSRRTYAWTLIGVCLIGYLDELLQGLLPNRVYDPRDLVFNGVAGALGLAAVILVFDPVFLG